LLLPLVCVLASLLPPTAAAAADDVYILATEGASGPAQQLVPVGQTAAGLVYRDESTSTTWIKRPGWSAIPQQENRLGDPTVIGDLLSRFDAESSTLRWRTIADPTLRESPLPPELTFVTRTARGYLARQGSGPYDLVAVDLLAGGTRTVMGSVEQVDGVLTGPLGAAVPSSDVPDDWHYFPYDGSATAGLVAQAPAGSDECALAVAHLVCWSATELTRQPLTGGPSASVSVPLESLVAGPDGSVAYTKLDPIWHAYEIWVWRPERAEPVRAAFGAGGFTAQLAPASGPYEIALGMRTGGTGRTELLRVATSQWSSGTELVFSWGPKSGTATSIALGPGRVAWAETGAGIRGRDIGVRDDGGLEMGELGRQAGGNGTALSVSGRRIAYATSSGLGTTVTGDPVLAAPDVVSSTLSGQRVVWQSRDADGVLAWQLTDLTAKTTEPLADALSYDLWGERLARVAADGSVWLRDLRTGGDPVELAPALDGGAQSGTVQVAGDAVAWDVTPADPDAPDPGVLLRDVTSMESAEPVSGLSELQDVSTGYAVGCGGDDGCSPRAVSLADGTVTPVVTDKPLAVDGNVLGFITAASLPAVRILPTYPDEPRLLASPGVPDAIDFARKGLAVRVAASQPLTTCSLEIRDGGGELVVTVPCGLTQYGATTVEWNGLVWNGSILRYVLDGTYSWRIVATNGDRPLVDYDGSTSGVGGTLIVDSPPDAIKMVPGPGSYGAALGTGVSVTFDEPVTDVSGTTFQLLRPDGTTVPGSVTYNAGSRTATLKPSAPLSPLTRYTVTVSGITDLRGNPVPRPAWAMAFSTGPASTASHCSLVLPSKIVVDAKSVDMDFRIASNCTTNGADHAYWDLRHTDTGSGWAFRFESADLVHPNWYVTWPDTAPMGTWSLKPVEAERADGIPLPQNSAVIQAKFGSRLSTTVTRTSTALSWAVTATQWSPTKHAWNVRPRVSVGLFHLPTGSTTWKYVKSVTTSSTGKATVTLGSPKSGSYRLTGAETATVWASYSTPVRGS
jgi:hypothetical protein